MTAHQLIPELQKCAGYCLWCSDLCLDEDDLKKMVPCIRTDRACAEMCTATANLLSMRADPATDMVKLCREICERCAEECEKHTHDHCVECAKVCRSCAEACRAYAA